MQNKPTASKIKIAETTQDTYAISPSMLLVPEENAHAVRKIIEKQMTILKRHSCHFFLGDIISSLRGIVKSCVLEG